MKIAILLYPGFTSLDAIGPYEMLVHAPGAETMLVAKEKALLTGEKDIFKMMPSHDFSEVTEADILLIPGGPGEMGAATDTDTIEWVQKIHATTRYTTSVCTGALILAKAGLLKNKDATTHWAAADALNSLGSTYKAERWVQEGKIITAAGVSAGIDMALYLLGEIMGPEVAMSMQLGTEYDPQPPFDSGSVAKADPKLHAALSSVFQQTMGHRYKTLVA
jgi:putative intracellular protease/amidase